MSSESFLNGRVTLHCGDSLDILRTLPEASIDACVTDPPYALVSIGKRFGKAGAAACVVPEGRSGAYARASAGFMGKTWDTGERAFAVEFWAEVYRVLKPGGHVLAFGGTRTVHRLTCAIEDAGFEIRDMVAWLYGSGFPKSHDVSKGIDRAAGADREVVGRYMPPNGTTWNLQNDATRSNVGAVGHNSRSASLNVTAPATDAARQWEGWGTALKPALEPITFARKPPHGTVAENVLAFGTGAVNIAGCRVNAPEGVPLFGNGRREAVTAFADGLGCDARTGEILHLGRWPANVILDGSDEVVAAFPETTATGVRSTASINRWSSAESALPGQGETNRKLTEYAGDSGSAARFFYNAKADSDDRVGSKHPTVKPVDLMRYLVRLVTPPGGTVLDPFAGTGTTGAAAYYEGFSAVLLERETEYQADIRRRMALCLAGPDERRRAIVKAKAKPDDLTGTLFAPPPVIAAG